MRTPGLIIRKFNDPISNGYWDYERYDDTFIDLASLEFI